MYNFNPKQFNWYTYTRDILTIIWESGDVEFYCDGDLHFSWDDIKELVAKINQYVYARRQWILSGK